MKGRAIVVEYLGEPRSLREVGLMIGVSPRAMANRWEAGKRGAELFAPPDERMKRRGNWGLLEVGDVVGSPTLCMNSRHP